MHISRRSVMRTHIAIAALFFGRCRTFRLFSETAAQEREDGSLLRLQSLDSATQFALGLRFELKHQVAVQVGRQTIFCAPPAPSTKPERGRTRSSSPKS